MPRQAADDGPSVSGDADDLRAGDDSRAGGGSGVGDDLWVVTDDLWVVTDDVWIEDHDDEAPPWMP